MLSPRKWNRWAVFRILMPEIDVDKIHSFLNNFSFEQYIIIVVWEELKISPAFLAEIKLFTKVDLSKV